MKTKALKAAFPLTLPVMAGYLFLGSAYGFLMSSKGYGIGWTALISIVVFAGSMQYAGLTLLTSAFNPIYALVLTLAVNARHLFYGISMLTKYNGIKKIKSFLIFGLTDETFSINFASEPPSGISKGWFYFFITLLNYTYWITAGIAGNILRNVFTFDTKGIDFVLTALFLVIFINQWTKQKKHTSALIGVLCSVACLLLFGKENFIIPAMVLIIIALFAARNHIERELNQ